MPVQSLSFPEFKPFKFGAGADEELHFHLFKLSHTKDKLPGNNLIAECFPNLSNTERYFHTAGFHDIQEVNKDSLCRFGAQENGICIFADRSHLG